MEMPGSAPGVQEGRWQYCPMRTRRLCELTLAVAALHAIGWRFAGGGLPALAPVRAGGHRVALVSVPQAGKVPAPTAQAPPEAPVAPSRPPRAAARPVSASHGPVGAGGSARPASADAAAWPVYPTRPPPSTALRYALVQGGREAAPETGSAELEWQSDPGTYSLRLATRVGDRPPREWRSIGAFDAAGVAPLRLVEHEGGRDRRALNFDRDGGRVRFSSATDAPAFAPGVQDRWSWIAQLAAIAEDATRRGRLPARWHLQVAGLHGELERWTFQVLPPGAPPPELASQGNDVSAPGGRAPALLHVLRATQRPYDLRIEAWLSPSLHHLPAGLRMSTPPGRWSLSLWRRDA
jgi:hypothetical protein